MYFILSLFYLPYWNKNSVKWLNSTIPDYLCNLIFMPDEYLFSKQIIKFVFQGTDHVSQGTDHVRAE